MATAVLDTEPKSLAEVLHELGDVPLERIRFPAGNATEQDVIIALEAANKRPWTPCQQRQERPTRQVR